MPPGSNSVVSANTSVTAISSTSGDLKSLKNFEADEDYHRKLKETLKDINFKKSDVCLVSVPKDFPVEKLSEIPLELEEDFEVDGNGIDHFVCENVTSALGKVKLLAVPDKNDTHKFLEVSRCFNVRKTVKKVKVNKRNFIPRPEAPKISDGLFERVQPFGWQQPGTADVTLGSNLSTAFPLKQKNPKGKKQKKRKLENSDRILEDEVDNSQFMLPKKHKKINLALPRSPEIPETHSAKLGDSKDYGNKTSDEDSPSSKKKKNKKEKKKKEKGEKKAKKKKKDKSSKN